MATSNTKRNVEADKNGLYSTSKESLDAAYIAGLFENYDVFYDPCNGLGDISDYLESKGKKVYRNDLLDYGTKYTSIGDFLEVESIPQDVECIIMNPPFKLTEEFVDKALSLCDNLVMFNRATVLETASRSKKHNHGQWPLKEFHSFANRVSCTQGVDRDKTNNAVWYGWFVYDKKYLGNPEIHWLFTK